MKKIALFALAALCVTAAQAITVDWTAKVTSNGKNAGDYPGWHGIVILAGVHSITNATLCTTAQPHTGEKTFEIADGYTALAQTNYTNAQTGDLSVPYSASGSFEIDLTENNSITLVIFNKSWNKASSYIIADVDQWATKDNDSIDFGVINFEKQETLYVPEPTALALLALGVAGLALKRKHA